MRAIRVYRTGGPEQMKLEELPTPEPGPGQARVRVAYSGVNYIDIYHRTGTYPKPVPFIPGSEGAGVVEAVGDGVNLRPGERVAWAMQTGSYTQHAVVDGWRLVPVPDGLELAAAASVLLQGMTAHYLTHSAFPLHQGHVALVHAAAGGVGLLMCQIARQAGARIIGTVSTEEKAALAHAAGADDVILYTKEDFREAVRRLTDRQGVDVVYDSVGKTTFTASLDCLRARGTLVLFGQSSGPVPAFDPNRLSEFGSLFLTRTSLAHYAADRAELLGRARDLFAWLAAGQLSLRIDRELPLEAAAEAHRLLEGRATAGKLVLACTTS
ncbi:MAG: quinone oxidoreductase [Gemmatimonadota bacterium]|nr:quinone oxidoreductase [Gemmatimonadota bacterium]